MQAGRAGLSALALALALWAAPARAERFLYTAHAAAGPLLRLAPAQPARVQADLLFQSVFGFAEDWNVEVPLFIELGPAAVSLGVAAEYVFFHDNHWRLDVGLGGLLRFAFQGLAFGGGPYLKASVRWLFAWGLGAQLSLHAVVQVAGPAPLPTFLVLPSLGLYQEFW